MIHSSFGRVLRLLSSASGRSPSGFAYRLGAAHCCVGTGHALSLPLFFLLLAAPLFAQPTPLTADQTAELAAQRSALIKAEQAKIAQAQFAQKSAWNLPAPEIQMESPSGAFYTVGGVQSFSFPTVYVRQLQTAKAATSLANAALLSLEQQIQWESRLQYLKAQYAQHIQQQLQAQDSLWTSISAQTLRLLNAGEINALDKLLIDNQLSAIKNQLLAAQGLKNAQYSLLENYTGLNQNNWILDSFALLALPATADASTHPDIAFYKQNEALQQRNLQLERARQLPSFYFGYLNQSQRNSPIALRFRAGITLPLWYGLGIGQIKAAKQGITIAQQQTQARQQSIERQLAELLALIQAKKAQIDYFDTITQPQYAQTLAVAERLWRAGEYSYSDYCSLYADIRNRQMEYPTLRFDFNVLVLEYQYLADSFR